MGLYRVLRIELDIRCERRKAIVPAVVLLLWLLKCSGFKYPNVFYWTHILSNYYVAVKPKVKCMIFYYTYFK